MNYMHQHGQSMTSYHKQSEMEAFFIMDGTNHPYQLYFHRLMPVLESKVEEFKVLGYGKITTEDLWSYLTQKKWRKPKDGIRMNELVADIFSTNIGEYMNFAALEAYKSPNLFADLDSEELQELLNPQEDNG